MASLVKLTKLCIKERGEVIIINDQKELNDFFSKKVKVSCSYIQKNVTVRLTRLTNEEIQHFLDPAGNSILSNKSIYNSYS